MQIQAKIGGILYNRGGKPGSNYPDLEPGKEFWNRLLGRASDYKSLIYNNNLLSITICTKLLLLQDASVHVSDLLLLLFFV